MAAPAQNKRPRGRNRQPAQPDSYMCSYTHVYIYWTQSTAEQSRREASDRAAASKWVEQVLAASWPPCAKKTDQSWAGYVVMGGWVLVLVGGGRMAHWEEAGAAEISSYTLSNTHCEMTRWYGAVSPPATWIARMVASSVVQIPLPLWPP